MAEEVKRWSMLTGLNPMPVRFTMSDLEARREGDLSLLRIWVSERVWDDNVPLLDEVLILLIDMDAGRIDREAFWEQLRTVVT